MSASSPRESLFRFVALAALGACLVVLLSHAAPREPREPFSAPLKSRLHLGLLGCFKYFDFFSTNVARALSALGFEVSAPLLGIALPVGISSYVSEPQLHDRRVPRQARAAAQLARSRDLPRAVPPARRRPHRARQHDAPAGGSSEALRPRARLARPAPDGVGLLQDVAVIANKVFSLADPGFSLVWVGTLAFGIQIYADFSAYSDIARGTARLLGFELMRNFDHPYLAQSPGEFWRRWHISLSTWFRDLSLACPRSEG